MMIAFITCNSSLVPLLEGLCSSNPCRSGFSVFCVFAGRFDGFRTQTSAHEVVELADKCVLPIIDRQLKGGWDSCPHCVTVRRTNLRSRERYAAPTTLVTCDWDPFLGPLERSRVETGADQWALRRGEFPGFARVHFHVASLGHPL